MTTATKDKQTVTGSAHARWADLGEAATEMERDPRYERDNTFRQEAMAVRADVTRFVEEHFDELLAEKAADAVAAYGAFEQTASEDARAACARMAQSSVWRPLLDTPKGRQITRDARELSIHEIKVLTQSAQAAEAARDGFRSGWSNTARAPRQVPMPREFAEHLGLWKPVLH